VRLLQVMAGGAHGGAELFYEDLVPALGRAGFDQACVIRPYPTRAALLTAAGCRVTPLSFGGPLDLVTPWKLRGVAAREKPDVILGWMNRACRMLPRGPWVNVGRLGGYYDLKYYRRCDQLICNTPDIAAYVIREGWPAARAHYVPNFCTAGAEPPADRAALNTPPTARVLLILARLHEAKGIDVALRALVSIADAILWIAGEGPLEDALKSLAVDLGVAERVRFLGWRADRSALLKAADVCLVPSRHEPFGNVVIHAWAHGVPLVAAASQGPGFLVRDGEDGLIVPVEDAPALAAAISALLANPGLGRHLAAGGLERTAAEFSETAVVTRYREVLQTVTR
jgi:glycosyltransferase involved in cell wall biosynthesis